MSCRPGVCSWLGRGGRPGACASTLLGRITGAAIIGPLHDQRCEADRPGHGALVDDRRAMLDAPFADPGWMPPFVSGRAEHASSDDATPGMQL